MKSRYLTVVLRMPDDAGQCEKVVDAIGIGKNFYGAEGLAMSTEDEITLNELLVEEVGEDRADELRAKVHELHARSEEASTR
jgi:hypothetical protein